MTQNTMTRRDMLKVSGLTALGLAELLARAPILTIVFKLLAIAWILYLAWALFRSARMGRAEAEGVPNRRSHGVEPPARPRVAAPG